MKRLAFFIVVLLVLALSPSLAGCGGEGGGTGQTDAPGGGGEAPSGSIETKVPGGGDGAPSGSEATPVYGDFEITGDGCVDIMDVTLVAQRWGETGKPGWIAEDVKRDGVIDQADIDLVREHMGEGCQEGFVRV